MINPKRDDRGSTLTSCHSFNVADCDYNCCCSDYARDNVTFIVFTAFDTNIPETLNNRKTTRQIFMYKPYHKQKQLPKNLDTLKLIIEIDRHGSNDAVFYNCANPDFEEYIASKGFKTAQGSFSDISLIAPELGIAAVNLSSGYYHAHSLHEFINRSDLDNTIQKVIKIVSDVAKPDFPKFEYIAASTQNYTPRKKGCNDKPLICESYFYENPDDIPCSVPEELHELYEALLDFYSSTELESFRQEYGNQIIPQLYREVLDSYYSYPIST